MPHRHSPEVVVIGIDAATWDAVSPSLSRGELPTFTRLIKEGVSGKLESTYPPVTSPAWPTFMTGKNPAKHGVFDFMRHTQGRLEIVSSQAIQAKTLWQILSEKGKRVGVMNVPVTYPPAPVNGFLIAGGPRPLKSTFTFPADLLAPYEGKLGPYLAIPSVAYSEGQKREFLDHLLEVLRREGDYALALLRDHALDFFMVHFLPTDGIQHYFWRFLDAYGHQDDVYSEAIPRAYRLLDEILAEILALTSEETTLIVLSDHGMGPLQGVINVNNLFLRNGLLSLKKDPTTRAKHFLFQRGLTPTAVYRRLAELGLQNLTRKISKQARNRVVGQFLSFSDVDWSRTRAYALGHMGQIYVNLRGREPKGIVEPGQEYEQVREEIIQTLYTLKDPVTRRPLACQVWRREEVYHGPYFDRAPDLLVMWEDYRYIAYPLFASNAQLVSEHLQGQSGSHRLHGIILAKGPHMRKGERIEGARLVDLAPTILYASGLPVPEDMDGRVLLDFFEPVYLETHPISYETAPESWKSQAEKISPDEEKEMRERLKGLGYLG